MAFTPSLTGGSYSSGGFDVLGTGNLTQMPSGEESMGLLSKLAAPLGMAAGAGIGSLFGPGGATVGASIGGSLTSGMFGGGSTTTTGGYTLPPEYELQYLDYFKNSMTQLQQSYQQLSSVYGAYTQKLDALNSIIGGGDKNQALQQLQQSNYNIAQGLGMSSEDMVKNGFITSEDRADIDKMSQLSGSPDQLVKDPGLEQQINDQRARTEQDLRRQGASGAAVAQALSKFDIAANQARFQRSQDLRQTQFGQLQNIIGTRAGLRQQGFGQAANTLNQNQGFANQALGLLGSNYGNVFQGQQQVGQQGIALNQAGTSNYGFLGALKLSSGTRAAVQSGLTGPGTVYQQTGVAPGAMGNYRDWVSQGETLASTGQSMAGYQPGVAQYGPQAYQAFKGYQQGARGPGQANLYDPQAQQQPLDMNQLRAAFGGNSMMRFV